VSILLLAGTLVIVMLNQEEILQRTTVESEVFGQILDNERDDTDFSSTGLRLNAWVFGLGKVAEKPVFGWGPGTTSYLVEQSGMPEKLRTFGGVWLQHLHNTYIEVLVQFGLIGLLWVLVILLLLGRVVHNAERAGKMPRHYVLFFIAAFVFAMIWSIFNYRIVHRDWLFSWILLAGTIFSFHLQMILDKAAEAPGSDAPE
jgi:O-antigen ligase